MMDYSCGGLLAQLSAALKAKNEAVMVGIIEEICTLLCIGTEDCLRGIDSDEYVSTLTEVLMLNSPIPELSVFAMRAIALVLDSIPSSATASVAEAVVPLVISQLSQPTVTPQLAEEVLKTLEALSLDHPHAVMQTGRFDALLAWVEPARQGEKERLYTRILALGILTNVSSRLRPSDWDNVSVVVPLLAGVVEAAVTRKAESSAERGDVDATINRACLVLAHLVDRLSSVPALFEAVAESSLLNSLLSLLSPCGGNGTGRRRLPAPQRSFILRVIAVLYCANPAQAVPMFVRHGLFAAVGGLLSSFCRLNAGGGGGGGGGGGTAAAAEVDVDDAEEASGEGGGAGGEGFDAANGGASASTHASEEATVCAALDCLLFLLPVLPANPLVEPELLIPFHSWTWEDDNRAFAEFDEVSCHRIEAEYEQQRKACGLEYVDIVVSCRTYTLDYDNMRRVSSTARVDGPLYRDPVPAHFARCQPFTSRRAASSVAASAARPLTAASSVPSPPPSPRRQQPPGSPRSVSPHNVGSAAAAASSGGGGGNDGFAVRGSSRVQPSPSYDVDVADAAGEAAAGRPSSPSARSDSAAATAAQTQLSLESSVASFDGRTARPLSLSCVESAPGRRGGGGGGGGGGGAGSDGGGGGFLARLRSCFGCCVGQGDGQDHEPEAAAAVRRMIDRTDQGSRWDYFEADAATRAGFAAHTAEGGHPAASNPLFLHSLLEHALPPLLNLLHCTVNPFLVRDAATVVARILYAVVTISDAAAVDALRDNHSVEVPGGSGRTKPAAAFVREDLRSALLASADKVASALVVVVCTSTEFAPYTSDAAAIAAAGGSGGGGGDAPAACPAATASALPAPTLYGCSLCTALLSMQFLLDVDGAVFAAALAKHGVASALQAVSTVLPKALLSRGQYCAAPDDAPCYCGRRPLDAACEFAAGIVKRIDEALPGVGDRGWAAAAATATAPEGGSGTGEGEAATATGGAQPQQQWSRHSSVSSHLSHGSRRRMSARAGSGVASGGGPPLTPEELMHCIHVHATTGGGGGGGGSTPSEAASVHSHAPSVLLAAVLRCVDEGRLSPSDLLLHNAAALRFIFVELKGLLSAAATAQAAAGDVCGGGGGGCSDVDVDGSTDSRASLPLIAAAPQLPSPACMRRLVELLNGCCSKVVPQAAPDTSFFRHLLNHNGKHHGAKDRGDHPQLRGFGGCHSTASGPGGITSATHSGNYPQRCTVSAAYYPLSVTLPTAMLCAAVLNTMQERMARPFALRCCGAAPAAPDVAAGGDKAAAAADHDGEPEAYSVSMFPFATFSCLERWIIAWREERDRLSVRRVGGPAAASSLFPLAAAGAAAGGGGGAASGDGEASAQAQQQSSSSASACDADTASSVATIPPPAALPSAGLSAGGSRAGNKSVASGYSAASHVAVASVATRGGVESAAASTALLAVLPAGGNGSSVASVVSSQDIPGSPTGTLAGSAATSTRRQPPTGGEAAAPAPTPTPASATAAPHPLRATSAAAAAAGPSDPEVAVEVVAPLPPAEVSQQPQPQPAMAAARRSFGALSIPGNEHHHASCPVQMPFARVLSPIASPLAPNTLPLPSPGLQTFAGLPQLGVAGAPNGAGGGGIPQIAAAAAVGSSAAPSLAAASPSVSGTLLGTGTAQAQPSLSAMSEGRSTDRHSTTAASTVQFTRAATVHSLPEDEVERITGDRSLPVSSLQFMVDGHVVPTKRMTIMDAAILFSHQGAPMRRLLAQCATDASAGGSGGGGAASGHVPSGRTSSKAILGKALALWNGCVTVQFRRVASPPLPQAAAAAAATAAAKDQVPKPLFPHSTPRSAGASSASERTTEASDAQGAAAAPTPPPAAAASGEETDAAERWSTSTAASRRPGAREKDCGSGGGGGSGAKEAYPGLSYVTSGFGVTQRESEAASAADGDVVSLCLDLKALLLPACEEAELRQRQGDMKTPATPAEHLALGGAPSLSGSRFDQRLCAAVQHDLRLSALPIAVLSLSPLTEVSTDARRHLRRTLTRYPTLHPLPLRMQHFNTLVYGARLEVLRSTCSLTFSNGLTGLPYSRGTIGSQWLRSYGGFGAFSTRPSHRTQKALVLRSEILHCAEVLLQKHAATPLPLDVYFDREPGTGLGPTTEFFTLVSRELQRAALGMWRDDDDDAGGAAGGFVRARRGLYPALLHTLSPAGRHKVLQCFTLAGRLIGRALRESKSLDLTLNPVLVDRLFGGNPLEEASRSLSIVEPLYERSLQQIAGLAEETKAAGAAAAEEAFEALGLAFTLPGHDDVPLISGGEQTLVTPRNYKRYIDLVRASFLSEGVDAQVDAILSGINDVFPPEYLRIFTKPEFVTLLCGRQRSGERIWETSEQLWADVVCDHGYTKRSPAVLEFVDVVVEMSGLEQSMFLAFVSGSPRMPMAGLVPKLTVVRRGTEFEELEDGCALDHPLPTVNTCFHYLKLPPYSSKALMKAKLMLAISEGREAFELS